MLDTRRRMSRALLFSRAPGERAWRERLAARGSLAAAALAIALAGGCGSSHGAREHTAAIAQSRATAAEVSSLLAGIRQQGSTLGDPKAPVTVEYFADLQCPFCRKFTLLVLPSLIRRYVRSGELKIEYRSLETATHYPETFRAQQIAALAAGEQNKMWNFIDLFYHEQSRENSGYVSERYLQGLAQQVPGLDLVGWTAARSDPELARHLASDARAAFANSFNSTPSFLVRNPRHAAYVPAIEKMLRG
jgi:protein-disulfide isomerase